MFEITKYNRLLPKSEFFKGLFDIFWNGMMASIQNFTKLTFLSWVQYFRSHSIIFSPNIYIVILADTHMYLQPCTFYDSQGTETLPSFWTFQRGIHSRTLACLRGHSTTTWTKFYSILNPSPLEWTNMDLSHTIYLLPHDPPWTFYRPPSPLLVHVVIGCPLNGDGKW